MAIRTDGVCIRRFGQRKSTLELAGNTFTSLQHIGALFCIGRALAGQRQQALFRPQVNIVRGNAWQVGAKQEALFFLDDVDGGDPAGRPRVSLLGLVEKPVVEWAPIAIEQIQEAVWFKSCNIHFDFLIR